MINRFVILTFCLFYYIFHCKGQLTPLTIDPPVIKRSASFQLSCDVDLDGNVDIVYAGRLPESYTLEYGLFWIKNMGSGVFDSVQTIAADGDGVGYYNFQVLDFDLDGDTDVVSLENDLNIVWFENDGQGHFLKHDINTNSFDFGKLYLTKLVDFDNDGDIDVIHDRGNSGEIYVLNNDGNMNFDDQLEYDFNGFINEINVIDIENDGDYDFIISEANSDPEKDPIHLVKKDGLSYSIQLIDSFAFTNSTFNFFDYNGDGFKDMFVAYIKESYTYGIKFYENTSLTFVESFYEDLGDVTFESDGGGFYDYPLDFDNNGYDEFYYVDEGDKIYQYKHNGNTFDKTLFYKHENNPLSNHRQGKLFANNGTLDVGSISFLDISPSLGNEMIVAGVGELFFVENVQNSSIIQNHIFSFSSQGDFGIIDFDNDADDDIVTLFWGKIQLFKNNDNYNFEKKNLLLNEDVDNLSFQSIYSAYIDEDNFKDLVVTTSLENKILWYKNFQGDTLTGPFEIDDVGIGNIQGIYQTQIRDLDNDGDMDIVSKVDPSSGSEVFKIYVNNGLGEFSVMSLNDVEINYISDAFTLGYVDSDDLIDLIYSEYLNIFWLKNLGGNQFASPQPILSSIAAAMESKDIDNDGDEDLIHRAGPSIFVANNDGNGNYTDELLGTGGGFGNYFTNTYKTKFEFIDVDGDLDGDLVFSEYTDHRILYFENLGNSYDAVAQLLDSIYNPAGLHKINFGNDNYGLVSFSVQNDELVVYADTTSTLVRSASLENYGSISIGLFPNPSQDGTFTFYSEHEIYEIQVFSSLGKYSKSYFFQNEKPSIQLDQRGVFFFKVITSQGINIIKGIHE